MMKNGFIATICATFAMTVQALCVNTDLEVETPFYPRYTSLCDFFNKYPGNCGLHGEILAPYGHYPLEMCCGCGGGEYPLSL